MKTYHYNLGQYFDEVATAHGKRPALRYSDRSHSYAELLDQAVSLAALLLARGCQRGDVIAIGHNKRPLSYALMLAALRLGIPYVNIDVGSPLARNLSILQTSRAALLFYDDEHFAPSMTALAAAHECDLLLLEAALLSKPSNVEQEQQNRLMREVDGATVAYVMFTSGSTGLPKGVAVTHQNVLHFIAWGQDFFGITEEDNFANLSPMYFDNSVFDFYVGLFSGASLSPVFRELATSPYELVTHVETLGCSVWFSVPSLLIYLTAMKALKPDSLPALRVISFGGEGYPKAELKKVYDLFSARAELVNVYGPTECTCICSAYRLGGADFEDLTGLPPLGQLNANFDYLILNEDGHNADAGELCLIGPNVAAGYFNDLERSEASFFTLTDPQRFMKRMYRTGDLVQEVAGVLHFVGRKDNQIKHMGYRIELEEIEHALSKLPSVNQAAVIYQRTNSAYGKLIGFVACEEEVDEWSLREALGKFLPDYMVPSRIFVWTELPKNANGKVDRQQLKALL